MPLEEDFDSLQLQLYVAVNCYWVLGIKFGSSERTIKKNNSFIEMGEEEREGGCG